MERMLRIGGGAMHVREEGEGPAVLLLHGIPTNGTLWDHVVPRLAHRARVVVPDLAGYGRSDPPRGRPVDVAAQTGYVREMMDELGIARATVVGHDIGGGVAQRLAVLHPDRVERLGLVNSVSHDSWPIPEMRAIQVAAPVVERLPAGLTMKGIEAGLLRGFVHRDRGERFLEAFLAPFSTAEGLDAFVELARSLNSASTQEVAPGLARLRIPVAIAWGMQDPFQKPEWADRLAAEIPGATLTRIDDASHFSPADAPEAVADAIEALLDRPAAPW